MNPLERAVERFQSTYHARPAFVARAPGRVNLLGEHVDYNEGWVLPAAIDRAAYVAATPGAASPASPAAPGAASALVSLAAADLNEASAFRVSELDALGAKVDALGKPLPGWARYPAGVAWSLRGEGLAVGGLDAVLASDVPVGAGLSSSAAVEVAFAAAWRHTGGWARSAMALAQACQRAENQYVGVNSGLMDQFASACGQAGQALLLDCRTLAWEALPLPAGVSIVVADTGIRRELGKSEYNTRRAQCEAAVAGLSAVLPGIRALRDVSPEDFNRYAHLLDPLVAKRARHVVEECARTQAAVGVLKAGRVADFGALMNDCHASLRDLYEVSCPELNVMAAAAQALPGCYGARLTGAGFGGCTVNLVAAEAADDFRRDLAAAYATATGLAAEIYVCKAAGGAEVMSV